MATTDPLPPAEARPDGLNRDAMMVDAAAVLLWLQSTAMWTLLDQTATLLLGRSPLPIVSELFFAVIELPELGDLLVLALDRVMVYRGVGNRLPLDDQDHAALAALRAAALGAFA